MKRYDLWSLSQDDSIAHQKNESAWEQHKNGRDTTHAKLQNGKLDELQTSLLLYNYGLPIYVALDAACTLTKGHALNCRTKSVSAERVDFVYADVTCIRCEKKDVGSTVHIDLERIGAVEGVIASQNNEGFQVAVDANLKTSLVNHLANMATRYGMKHDVTIASGPGIQRLEPNNKNCCFEDHNGRIRNGIIVNLSPVDALIRAQFIPPKQSIIFFKGRKRHAAEITSVFAIGFMTKFSTPISYKDFSADIQFTD